MFSKTKIALCIAIILGTASAAVAASPKASDWQAGTYYGSYMDIQDQAQRAESGLPPH